MAITHALFPAHRGCRIPESPKAYATGAPTCGWKDGRHAGIAVAPAHARADLDLPGRRWRLFGSRILMLEHIGRKSGAPRYVVLEVVDHPNPESYVVASCFGRKAQWFRNIRANPRVA